MTRGVNDIHDFYKVDQSDIAKVNLIVIRNGFAKISSNANILGKISNLLHSGGVRGGARFIIVNDCNNSDDFNNMFQICHNIKSIEGRQKIADMPLDEISVSKGLRISFAIPCRNSLRCNDCEYPHTNVCIGFNSALKNTYNYFNEHGFHFGRFIYTGFEYSFEPHQVPAFLVLEKLIAHTSSSSNSVQTRIEVVRSLNENLNSLIKFSHHPVNDEFNRRLNNVMAEYENHSEMLTRFIDEISTELINEPSSTFMKFINMMSGQGSYAFVYAYYMRLVTRNTVAEKAIPKLNAFNAETNKILSELDSLRTDIINEQARVFDEIVGSGETV